MPIRPPEQRRERQPETDEKDANTRGHHVRSGTTGAVASSLLALLGSAAGFTLGGGAPIATEAAPPIQSDGTQLTLQTRLTREYEIYYPFVGAGMAFVALPDLVAAVTTAAAGGGRDAVDARSAQRAASDAESQRRHSHARHC